MKKGENMLANMLMVTFILYTMSLTSVDLQPIGPNGSVVAFGSINQVVQSYLPFNQLWYNVSNIMGYLGLMVAGVFGGMGLKQLIQRKSLKKVDAPLKLLGVFLVMVGLFYVLFELTVINYRPILIDGELEASYPSSHTLLAFTVFEMCGNVLRDYIPNPADGKAIRKMFRSLIAIAVITRIFSGTHWITDIVGGVLLSLAISVFFDNMLTKLRMLAIEEAKQSESVEI